MNLDQTHDLTGADQHRLTQLYPPPVFVKEASHEQLYGDPAQLPAHVYAGAFKKVYPCHTKAATWMSALFFGDKGNNIKTAEAQEIRNRITSSAQFFGIGTEVQQLWEKMAQDAASGMSKLSDDDFALVWESAGRRERHYPLRNANEVKMASQWFGQYHAEFEFGDKHRIASKILTKAAAYGAMVEHGELLDRCAGFGYCSAADAAAAWDKRAGLVNASQPDYAQAARQMGETIRNATFEARDQGRRVKMASLMDQFDRQTKLYTLYDNGGLERPEETLFKITEKVASEFVGSHVQMTTGAIYEKMALDKLDITTLRQWLGDDMADAVGGVMLDTEKLAEILPTLPRPDAEMFERMARSAGVPVFAREKAAAAQGLSPQEMQELAAQYGQEQILATEPIAI